MKKALIHFFKVYRTGISALILLLFVFIFYKIFSYYFVYERDAFIEANIIQVAPEVSGTINHVYVKDLQSVKKGQLLFSIEPTPFLDSVKAAQANVKVSENNYNALLSQLKSYQAQLKTAKDDLTYQNAELKRYGTLAKEDFASLKKRDETLYQQQQAANNVNVAKMNIKAINAQLSLINGQFAPLKKAKTELKKALYFYHKTKIYSPIDGNITASFLQKGDYATAGDAVFVIVSQKTWWVNAKIKENHLSNIINKPVTIWLGTGETYTGHVQGIAWAVNRKEAGGSGKFSILPYVEKTEYWVDIPQRFPVRIDFNTKGHALHVGTSAKILIHKTKKTIKTNESKS